MPLNYAWNMLIFVISLISPLPYTTYAHHIIIWSTHWQWRVHVSHTFVTWFWPHFHCLLTSSSPPRYAIFGPHIGDGGACHHNLIAVYVHVSVHVIVSFLIKFHAHDLQRAGETLICVHVCWFLYVIVSPVGYWINLEF